jgi:uncharacterized protein (DUF305 family)
MIELHETAISLSEGAVDQKGRAEITDFARTVIQARNAAIIIMIQLAIRLEAAPIAPD